MPKLILVKTQTVESPTRLLPAVADQYDGTTEMVSLASAVIVDGELTLNVPRALCFEFDPDVMDLVNTLVNSATDKLDAARQFMTFKLVPVEFVFEDGSTDSPRLVNH